MHQETPFIAILVSGFVLAFVFGALANRLKLSPIVGYLLAGVVAGPFTPGFVADQDLATEIAEIGVILLMFGVGLHFSFKDLMAVKNIAVPGAIGQIAVATLMGMGLAWGLGWPLGGGLVFGLALSVASTVVLLRALEERGLLDTNRGRIAIGWLIVEDLVMVLVLVLLPAVSGMLGGAETHDASGDGPGLLLSLAITLGKVAAFIALMVLVGRRVIPRWLAWTAGTGSRELFTLAVLAIALGIAFGSAKLFGVSFALGAFFAGMILNGSALSHKAAEDSLPLRDAFAVLFFVSVGMLFDPSILLRNPLGVLAAFAIIVFGKSIAAFFIVRAFGHPRSTALTISVSLAQIGEFSFILMSLGFTLDLLPEEARDLVLAGSILSILANPFLFVALDRWQRRVGVAARVGHEPGTRRPVRAHDRPPPVREQRHVVLVGYGRVGSLVGASLKEAGVPLVVIEDSSHRVDTLRGLGYTALLGNAAKPEILQAAKIETARWLLVAIPNGFEAGHVVAAARAANPGIQIIARAHLDDEVTHLNQNGADLVIMGEREIAGRMLARVGVGETEGL